MIGQIGVAVLIAYVFYTTFGAVIRVGLTHFRLRRDPIRWLSKRGVMCDPGTPIKVMWLRGQVRGRVLNRFPSVAAALTPDFLVLETQVPDFIGRRRLVLRRGETLRLIKEQAIADPQRRCQVWSDPPFKLVSVLEDGGWTLKRVMC